MFRLSKECIECNKVFFKPITVSVKRWNGDDPKRATVKRCSQECYYKAKTRMSSWNKGLKGYNAGSEHYNWQGGITPVNHKIRTSTEYAEWRKSVFERDSYACVDCGTRSGNGVAVILHADHIKPFAYFPELRLALDNGRTLCVGCHRKTDTFARRLKIYTNV